MSNTAAAMTSPLTGTASPFGVAWQKLMMWIFIVTDALFVWLTILGGLSFLGMQAYEWSHFIHEGARLTSNPWGVPQFSAAFFIITGFHGMHVTTGVTILRVVAIRSAMGKYSAQGVENAGLYWHFVDLVWVFVFALFYLV